LSQARFGTVVVLAWLAALSPWRASVLGQWPQWGGPDRNFKVAAEGLAAEWPAGGPRRLWERPLAGGYSSLLVDEGLVYAMHRADDDEVMLALDAATGKEKWSSRYAVRRYKKAKSTYGDGPNATPLIAGEYIISVGYTALVRCLAKKSGTLIWKHDLIQEFDGKIQDFGYSASPLLYGRLVICLVGGVRNGVVAFRVQDGSIAWKSEPLDISYASPFLLDVDGQDQVVTMSSTEVLGLAAKTGKLLWRFPQENHFKNNCMTPVWGDDGRLFVSSHAEGGGRLLKLNRKGGTTTVDEQWANGKIRVVHSNAVWVGDYVYGSIGELGPFFLAAIDLRSGEFAWREREFSRAMCVYTKERMFVLDEEGALALVSVSPQGLTVHSKVKILQKHAWTPPTLTGRTLFVRDTKQMIALDVGRAP
jgi:outer membrane protein assembly factor BamB